MGHGDNAPMCPVWAQGPLVRGWLTQQSWTPALCMDMVWTLTLTFDLKGSPRGRLSHADPVLTDVCKCCCEWSRVLSLWE